MKHKKLKLKIAKALNQEGYDSRLNTPDYVLAAYLVACLSSLEKCKNHNYPPTVGFKKL